MLIHEILGGWKRSSSAQFYSFWKWNGESDFNCMAGFFHARQAGDLAVGKPPLHKYPKSLTVGEALRALKSSNDPELSLWEELCPLTEKPIKEAHGNVREIVCHVSSNQALGSGDASGCLQVLFVPTPTSLGSTELRCNLLDTILLLHCYFVFYFIGLTCSLSPTGFKGKLVAMCWEDRYGGHHLLSGS